MLICLHIVYSCVSKAVAELSGCNRDHMIQSLKYLLFGPVKTKFANLSFKLLIQHTKYDKTKSNPTGEASQLPEG